jgi:hypothetical protein
MRRRLKCRGRTSGLKRALSPPRCSVYRVEAQHFLARPLPATHGRMISGLRVANGARPVRRTTPGCALKRLSRGAVKRSETAKRFASTTLPGFQMAPSFMTPGTRVHRSRSSSGARRSSAGLKKRCSACTRVHSVASPSPGASHLAKADDLPMCHREPTWSSSLTYSCRPFRHWKTERLRRFRFVREEG